MNTFSVTTKSEILITQYSYCLHLWPMFLGHSHVIEQKREKQNLLKTHEMNTCSIYLCALCVNGDDDDPVTYIGTCHL